MNRKVDKDTKLVKILAAQAKNESLDSSVLQRAGNKIAELATNPSPDNVHTLSEVIRYTVNDIIQQQSNFLDRIADVRRIPFGDKASFRVEGEGLFAFIQAKGATTRRSKISSRNLQLETEAVSIRPSLNILEMQYGLIPMTRLITEAAYKMEMAELSHIQNVLYSAASEWSAPYYGEGTGVIAGVLNPMVEHWMRFGGATILGDISMVSQLAELTGFTAATNTQWGNGIIEEQNRNGFIGRYKGADVVQLINPYMNGSDNLTIDPNILMIIPNNPDPSYRPLKIVYEGELFSMEHRDIDDLTYDVRMDQYFGAGLAYGTRPNISIYRDTTV